MRIAVLTLTRDRLEYTQHCFSRLRDLSGCEFDHHVLDQASQDGTPQWLFGDGAIDELVMVHENIGVSRGMNKLLDVAFGFDDYDVIVKFDNDCELLIPDTLKVAAEFVVEHPRWIVSPHIQGLDSPPSVARVETIDGVRIGVPAMIGGIFMCAPAQLYRGFRHDEGNPLWGMDDVRLCHQWRNQGGEVGYLLDYPANHYETTQGQRARYPDYFTRKDAEFAA